MKRLLFIALVGLWANDAFAACSALSKTYTSCKPGYYLESGSCKQCPSDASGSTVTTVDKNTGDMTSCYIPSGASFSDTTGSGTYGGDCHYTN